MTRTRSGRWLGVWLFLVGGVLISGILVYPQWGPHGGPLVVLPEVDFDEVAVGTSETVEYVFTNPHGERATINALGFGDTFSTRHPPWPIPQEQAVFEITDSDPLPTTLRIGEQFRFTIRFSPQAVQTYRLDTAPDVLTMCATTTASGQHIHYLIPLVGTGTGEEPPATAYALLHSFGEAVVKIIDIAGGRLHANVSIPMHAMAKPLPIVVTPDGRYALLHSFGEAVVKIIDIAGGMLYANVSLPNHAVAKPLPIVVTPDGRYALLHSFGEAVIKIIDIAAGSLHANVSVPNHAVGIPLLVNAAPPSCWYQGTTDPLAADEWEWIWTW